MLRGVLFFMAALFDPNPGKLGNYLDKTDSSHAGGDHFSGEHPTQGLNFALQNEVEVSLMKLTLDK